MIGKALLLRQTAQEMQTGEVSKEWTEYLSSVIKAINKKVSHVVNKEPEKCVFLLHAMECLRLVCFGFWVCSTQ